MFLGGGRAEQDSNGWDWELYVEEQDRSQGLAMFGSVMVNSDEEIAVLPVSSVCGMVCKGLIPTRDTDKLGFIMSVRDHSRYNTCTHDFIDGNERGTETIVEMTCNLVVC